MNHEARRRKGRCMAVAPETEARHSQRLAATSVAEARPCCDGDEGSSSVSEAAHTQALDWTADQQACAAARNTVQPLKGGSLLRLAARHSPHACAGGWRERFATLEKCQDRPAPALEFVSKSWRGEHPPSRRRAPHPLHRSDRSRRCSHAVSTLLWFYCFTMGLMPSVRSVPPHLRACPGPLDGRDSQMCQSRGTVTFSAGHYRSAAGDKSSKCSVIAGIMNCTARLSEGRVLVTVQRQGGFAGPGGVSFSTASGSAESSLDFIAASGELSWGPFQVLLPTCPMSACLYVCSRVGIHAGVSKGVWVCKRYVHG
jgi:hypothetical protein